MKKIVAVMLVVVMLVIGCEATTKPELSCEDKYDRDIENGISTVEALGNYTQCLIDRGDTVTLNSATLVF